RQARRGTRTAPPLISPVSRSSARRVLLSFPTRRSSDLLMRISDAPALGDPKAPVTIVEYSDFQCPVCRSLHDTLRGILPNYPGKLRVIFKDFPLEQLHPWARTAAIAGRCAYQQKPQAFWKMYDLIYDNQELISA